MREVQDLKARPSHQLVILFYVHLKVAFYRCIELIRVIFRYYRIKSFLVADCLLAALYLFKSPYRVAKQFLLRQGALDPYAYGETPLTTLDHIVRECRLLAKDVVIELGCGNGRTVFWLACAVGCETIGIDFLPIFIQKAERVKKLARIHNINFKEEDFLTSDLRNATAIYLYGTTLDDDTIKCLVKRFSTLRKGTKVISVSYPLNDYADPSFFRVEKCFQATFPWGVADVYLNIRQ